MEIGLRTISYYDEVQPVNILSLIGFRMNYKKTAKLFLDMDLIVMLNTEHMVSSTEQLSFFCR